MSYNYKFLKRKLYYKDFSIENLKKTDLEKLRIWRNAQRKVLRQNYILSKRDQKNYFNKYISKQSKKKFPEVILFAYKYKKELIGYGGFVYISWDNNRAEVSYLLKTEYTLNKEYYKFYTSIYFKLIKKIAFKAIKFRRIFTETFVYRKNHIKLLEKVGFKKEGILRKHNIKNKKAVNVIVHSIVK